MLYGYGREIHPILLWLLKDIFFSVVLKWVGIHDSIMIISLSFDFEYMIKYEYNFRISSLLYF